VSYEYEEKTPQPGDIWYRQGFWYHRDGSGFSWVIAECPYCGKRL